jgi:hypothetical protein
MNTALYKNGNKFWKIIEKYRKMVGIFKRIYFTTEYIFGDQKFITDTLNCCYERI